MVDEAHGAIVRPDCDATLTARAVCDASGDLGRHGREWRGAPAGEMRTCACARWEQSCKRATPRGDGAQRETSRPPGLGLRVCELRGLMG